MAEKSKEEEKAKKIVIDREACISCGTCVSIAPEYFKLSDDDYKSTVIKQYDEKDKELLREAAKSCPVSAISIDDQS